MATKVRNFVAAVLLTGLIAYGSLATPSRSEEQTKAPRLTDGYNQLGLRLLGQIVPRTTPTNAFISPVSLGLSLALVRSGASGLTQQEITQVLSVEGISDEECDLENQRFLDTLFTTNAQTRLEMANGFWLKRSFPLRREFLTVAEKRYRADVFSIDFEKPSAAERINSWARRRTHGKIAEVIAPPVDPLLRLLLVNAAYFKGEWQRAFETSHTKPKPFTTPTGETFQHPRMAQTGIYPYCRQPGFEAVALPYGNGEVAMYVFLPDRNSSLDHFLDDLNLTNWNRWMGLFTNASGTVQLPRFRAEANYNLNRSLAELGMSSAFKKNAAEFPGISPPPNGLYISTVMQKVFVEVNEKGTEAAATTSIRMEPAGASPEAPPPFMFVVNRPFFVAIRENRTGMLLFIGTVTDPR